MFDVMKRHEIQVLCRAGHSQQEVAELTGVSERTIRRVEDEPAVMSIVADEPRQRGIGRPSKAEAFRGFVGKVLADEPDLLSLEILRRARLDGYQGGKSALYALIAAVRPKPIRPVVRFEGLPGEFSQHDFGHVDVRFMDGSTKRIHFFASRLKYSRWVEVTIVDNERVETLLRTLVDHFAGFGGIPLLAVFDRPKTVALHWAKDGTVTEWNPTFAAVALDLGMGVEVCWPRRGNQKGSIENLVGWVKGSFFKQRRFLDEADLLAQLAAWRVEVNTALASRATGVTPATRMTEDRARLRSLKVAPQDLALRIPVLVGPTGYVLHETHQYSMPPDAIGIAGTLFLYRERVRIVAARFSALHPRLFERDAKSTLPEHRGEAVARVSGKRGKRYLMREHLLEVGGAALDYLTELVHRRPGAWISEVERLHALLQQHGPDALRAAFEAAVAGQTFGAEYVRHYLRHPDPGAVQPPRDCSKATARPVSGPRSAERSEGSLDTTRASGDHASPQQEVLPL
jgi:transposase